MVDRVFGIRTIGEVCQCVDKLSKPSSNGIVFLTEASYQSALRYSTETLKHCLLCAARRRAPGTAQRVTIACKVTIMVPHPERFRLTWSQAVYCLEISFRWFLSLPLCVSASTSYELTSAQTEWRNWRYGSCKPILTLGPRKPRSPRVLTFRLSGRCQRTWQCAGTFYCRAHFGHFRLGAFAVHASKLSAIPSLTVGMQTKLG